MYWAGFEFSRPSRAGSDRDLNTKGKHVGAHGDAALDRSSTLLTSTKKHLAQGSPNGGPLLFVSSVIYRMNGKFDEYSLTFFKRWSSEVEILLGQTPRFLPVFLGEIGLNFGLFGVVSSSNFSLFSVFCGQIWGYVQIFVRFSTVQRILTGRERNVTREMQILYIHHYL